MQITKFRVEFAHCAVIIFSNFASRRYPTRQFAIFLQMTTLSQIKSLIETLEKDVSLHDPKNFDERADAFEFIEFHIIEPLQTLRETEPGQEDLSGLKSRIEILKSALEEIDNNLFERLRASIISGQCRGKAFEDLVREYFALTNIDTSREGYDNLDVFINRLFANTEIPEPILEPLPEMVFYQKTPARIVFEIARKVSFTKNDVFLDIGSGLGQVAILINLITGIPAVGIEFEPAFCQYAHDCAALLNVPGVSFINTDAREADYSGGTVFFLYTPFKGEMLQQVLARFKEQALQRQIRIITYGPCTAVVAQASWLKAEEGDNGDARLAVFKSI